LTLRRQRVLRIPGGKQAKQENQLHASFFLGVFFSPEDEGGIFPRNVDLSSI
jgi:hypothetical protein